MDQTADFYIDLYNDAKQQRTQHEDDWRLASAYCLPRQYASWNAMEAPPLFNRASMAAARRIAYDSTALKALPKWMAVVERMCTPHNMKWEVLSVSDRSLANNYRVRSYFDDLNDKLFRMRYEGAANFIPAVSEVYGSLGTYGNGPIFVGQRKKGGMNRSPGFNYRALAMRDIYVLIDDEGRITHVFRRMFMNARQFKMKFPDDVLPKCFAGSTDNKPQENTFCEFVHVVCYRDGYDPGRLDVKRHPFQGMYIAVSDKAFVGPEEGFASMPYLMPKLGTIAGDPYGSGPASLVLPSMGTASQMKKTAIKQGQKAIDPVLLVHDDGVLNGPVDLRPGAQNYGGVDKNGRAMIHTLPTGDFKVYENLLKDERDDINDAFFVSLFQIFMDHPEMTALQTMEYMSEHATVVAPTMGRIQHSMLEPMTMREIDMLIEMGQMPDMPPELQEAKGEYDLVYTSPMAKGLYADEVAGFMRSVDQATKLVEATGDPSHMDHFNFDTAIPEMAEFQATPTRWLNTDDQKAAIRQNRAQQQKMQQLLQNAGPLAQAAKAATEMQGNKSAATPTPGGQVGVPQQMPIQQIFGQ